MRPLSDAALVVRRSMLTMVAAALASAALVGCSADVPGDAAGEVGNDDTAPDDDPPAELAVAVASFDLAVGDDRRLLAGVFTPDRRLIAHGEVEFALAHLEDASDGAAPVDQVVTARFLPVPGLEPPEGAAERPTPLEDAGSGVYAAHVDLDEPGIWGLQVTAELEDGGTVTGLHRFEVLDETAVIDVGDDAPRIEHPTIDDVAAGDVEPTVIDSRAQEADDELPDAHLHRSTVAEAIEAGRPSVVAVTTPVYCTSRFCGPLTDVVADLAETYADRAEFVHLEVWKDHEANELNEAAAAFIQTETGGNEPWVFLLDDDGTVMARWDNVLDLDELTSMLDEIDSGA